MWKKEFFNLQTHVWIQCSLISPMSPNIEIKKTKKKTLEFVAHSSDKRFTIFLLNDEFGSLFWVVSSFVFFFFCANEKYFALRFVSIYPFAQYITFYWLYMNASGPTLWYSLELLNVCTYSVCHITFRTFEKYFGWLRLECPDESASKWWRWLPSSTRSMVLWK